MSANIWIIKCLLCAAILDGVEGEVDLLLLATEVLEVAFWSVFVWLPGSWWKANQSCLETPSFPYQACWNMCLKKKNRQVRSSPSVFNLFSFEFSKSVEASQFLLVIYWRDYYGSGVFTLAWVLSSTPLSWSPSVREKKTIRQFNNDSDPGKNDNNRVTKFKCKYRLGGP